MLTIITNGVILTEQGWLHDATITINGNKIEHIGKSPDNIDAYNVVDAAGGYIIPGGIDTHIHGGGGRDFMEGTEQAFRTAIEAHMRHGTTAIYPTLAASSTDIIERAVATTERLMAEQDSPVMGLHLEGPYFNPVMAGGQMPEYIRTPDKDEYMHILENTSCIKCWASSPELEGALEFGEYLHSKGIIASIAHTTADYPIVKAAYEAGYTHATHFYNAMTGVHKDREYKHEGTIESIYLMEDMGVELIADGIHIPPTILQLVYKIKGVERISLITDALGCSASKSGEVFDPRVIIEDGVCKLSDHSALAGSIATMDRLIRTMVEQANIPLQDAVRMASETPARKMGIYERKGSLKAGKDADIVIMNRDLQVEGVWAMGRRIQL